MSDRHNVLAVVAHPDDETLGMGGTLAKLAKQGHAVSVACLADGVSSRLPCKPDTAFWRESRLALRDGDMNAAARKLGVTVCEYGELPDQRLDSLDQKELADRVALLVQRTGAAVVYTHHPGDCNLDHRCVYEAVLVATRPQAGCSVVAVYAFEVPSATEWGYQLVPFEPNYFVDVADTLDAKLAACACYEKELRPFPHPRSLEAITARARWWGATQGVQAAEAFRVVRCLA